ncbi:MAG: hypothetical protein ABI461_16650, partial [Polyangiaceae bacterium]
SGVYPRTLFTMPITGSHPEKGIRLELALKPASEADAEKRVSYRGRIVTPDAEFAFEAFIADSGEVTAKSDAPADLTEKTRLVVRTAVRHATSEKSPLPRRIVRWRGDK